MADASTLKKIACDAIDAAAGELHALSQDIWEHPELNFQEKHAHDVS
jgi:metal-dependent amidase/aminoacylase/carboxypeptidase family protein